MGWGRDPSQIQVSPQILIVEDTASITRFGNTYVVVVNVTTPTSLSYSLLPTSLMTLHSMNAIRMLRLTRFVVIANFATHNSDWSSPD